MAATVLHWGLKPQLDLTLRGVPGNGTIVEKSGVFRLRGHELVPVVRNPEPAGSDGRDSVAFRHCNRQKKISPSPAIFTNCDPSARTVSTSPSLLSATAGCAHAASLAGSMLTSRHS